MQGADCIAMESLSSVIRLQELAPSLMTPSTEYMLPAIAREVDHHQDMIMGNLLTDMLSSDFPYGSSSSSSSSSSKYHVAAQDKFSSSVVPDIALHEFPGQASKMNLLQMLEDNRGHICSPPSLYDQFHLKLPVLQEDDQILHKIIGSPSSTAAAVPSSTAAAVPSSTEAAAEQPLTAATVKLEPLLLQDLQQIPAQQQQLLMLEESNNNEFRNLPAAAAAVNHSSEQNTSNSEDSSDVKHFNVHAAAGLSQCSSGGTANWRPQQQHQQHQHEQQQSTQQRPKRKRTKSSKNSEEVESQRQTHIAVERNRRKQMNEHLNVLKSLMPGSYVQRGDQASIIGGAIEFVKELEQLLQCLQSQKRRKMYSEVFSPKPSTLQRQQLSSPLIAGADSISPITPDSKFVNDNFYEEPAVAEAKSHVADIEVKLVGTEAVVKILSQRREGQLLKTIAGIESMNMTIVHTNITTIENTVLYSFNIKIGAGCHLSVDEIAVAVQQIFNMIHSNTSA